MKVYFTNICLDFKVSFFSYIGESAVGKSSLVLRFVKGQFHEYQESTIGGEISLFSLKI